MGRSTETVTRPGRRDRRGPRERSGISYGRWYWPSFTFPGIIWLAALFLLPFYVVLSVAFGTVDPLFRLPLPVYQPWWWSLETFQSTFEKFTSGSHIYLDPLIRTLTYVAVSRA